MDNEKFQELVLVQFEKLNSRFDSLESRFDGLESRFDSLEIQVKENTQILKALEHVAEVNKSEHDRIFGDIRDIKGNVEMVVDECIHHYFEKKTFRFIAVNE